MALELVAKYGGVGAALLGQPDLVPSMRSKYTSGMAIVFFLVLGPCLRWVFEWQQQLHYVDRLWMDNILFLLETHTWLRPLFPVASGKFLFFLLNTAVRRNTVSFSSGKAPFRLRRSRCTYVR